ncbi:hypothetical protein PMIN06_008988 [Paraphaeosphaeria minitans]
MPSLYGSGVRIHLASQPLAPTLTDHIQLKKGYLAASKSEQAEKALRESVHTLLPEERVPFPGDDGKSAVNWLGDVPFLQVVVGESYGRQRQLEALKQTLVMGNTYAAPDGNSRCSSQAVATSSGRLISSGAEHEESSSVDQFPTHGLPIAPSPYTPSANPQEPKALVLHVMLSDKTFYHNPFNSNPQHLKIDVLLNGQLSSSALIRAHDVRTGAKSLNQLFAGARIDYMAERPWVIHTPQCGAASGNTASAQTRWTEIRKALTSEANERGVDVNGERPPTARYLRELANMQMPDMVSDLQRPGRIKFGVIDVIITVGAGKKSVNNAVYLKLPTRLSDDRFCYEVNEVAGSGPCQTHASTSGPHSLDSVDRYAEGNSDYVCPVLTHETIYHGRPASSTHNLPLLPPHPALAWHNLFTGSPMRPLAPLAPPTSFVRSSLSFSGASEPPKKLGRFQVAADLQGEAISQMPPPWMSYPSAHGPSIPPRSLYAPSLTHTGFNVNQYDGFEHANPYQLPYAGMMAGLDFANLDGPASSPLRYGSGGQLTLPSYNPTPEEVIPSPSGTSAFSSPYSQPSTIPSQGSGAVFSSDTSTPCGSMSHGTFHSGAMFHPNIPPGYTLYGASLSPLGPLGVNHRPVSPYASVSYMPPPRAPSNGPPPPMGFFRVTEKPKTPPTESKLVDRVPTRPHVSLLRLVIRMGTRVVVSHHFTAPRLLLAKVSLAVDISAPSGSSGRAREASPGSAEQTKETAVRHRSNEAAAKLDTPSATLTNAVIDLAETTSSDKIERDSIPDSLTRADASIEAVKIPAAAAKGPEADPTVAKTLVPTRTSSAQYVYAPEHPKAETDILGVQGPKANLFVFDNPEELLSKKKSKGQEQSRSASPTNVDTPADELAAEHVHVIECQKVDRPTVSKGVDTGSSSPLSELSISPQLSAMAANSLDANSNMQVSPSALPTPAVPVCTERPASLHTSGPISAPASQPSEPPSLSILPASITTPYSVTTTLKRKRGPEQTPKRTSAGSYIKKPRSPDRLNAKDNPLLNRDCVIQYAVSENQGGALRQVKSERKGIFKEESVVMGCRFFVSGC